ncbi:MAG: transporter substrate-binding domain-containing protein [Coriobacteriia bacterium]|nr:transporter substrate-binding domain-containing protein [Coriobacteriia bacterium]
MSKKRSLVGLAICLMMAISLSLVGCGGSSGGLTITPGVLTVGSDCDYPPFIEMQGGQPSGFEYDLLAAIADEMGLELVYLEPQNFDTLLASVAAGTRMDVGVSSFTITDERKQLVNFTIPYFDSNQAVVTMIDSSYTNAMDLDGETVGAQSGTTGADWVRENLGPDTELKEFNGASELMASLVAGGVEGAFYDEPTAAFFVANTYTNSHIVQSIPTGEQYGIAVAQNNTELLNTMNEAMIAIKKNGVFDEIFSRHFPGVSPPSLAA